MAGEEGNGGFATLRRAAALDHLGEAVVGADVERVGRVGAPGIDPNRNNPLCTIWNKGIVVTDSCQIPMEWTTP